MQRLLYNHMMATPTHRMWCALHLPADSWTRSRRRPGCARGELAEMNIAPWRSKKGNANGSQGGLAPCIHLTRPIQVAIRLRLSGLARSALLGACHRLRLCMSLMPTADLSGHPSASRSVCCPISPFSGAFSAQPPVRYPLSCSPKGAKFMRGAQYRAI